ncbi:hypothetical protein L9F63_004212, partial [Diploptera punctata]
IRMAFPLGVIITWSQIILWVLLIERKKPKFRILHIILINNCQDAYTDYANNLSRLYLQHVFESYILRLRLEPQRGVTVPSVLGFWVTYDPTLWLV